KKRMFKEIVFIIVRTITAPEISWRKLFEEKNHESFLNRYLYPIFGVIALTSFIGGLWFVPDGNLQIALKNSIINIVTVYGGYYIASYILNETLPRFGITKDESHVQQFVGYASALIYTLFIILPFLSDFFILWLFSFYTAYIVYMGYGVYISGYKDSQMSFTGVATALILITPALIKGILTFLIK
ncbi:MAG: hypothetical protein PHO84_03125, partial [Dysgonamonadaceae bacterium]|nr:hypothetical protein [Dysgonamonadaceae bacterium]